MVSQNVVVSDAKTGIITVSTVSNSSVFTPSAQKPPTAPGYISISKKKLLKNLEINGAQSQRLNSWVDSMRASSPTHLKSLSSFSSEEEHNSWIVSSITHFFFPRQTLFLFLIVMLNFICRLILTRNDIHQRLTCSKESSKKQEENRSSCFLIMTVLFLR